MPQVLVRAPDQPIETDMVTADDIFLKSIFVKDANIYLPQHSHRYDHTTILAVGSIDVWRENAYAGRHTAPAMLFIPANTKHLFKTLVPGTLIICAHNALRSDVAAVIEEHDPTGSPIP